MNPEKRLWNYLKQGMGNKWHAQRHEDVSAQGVPDVSYGVNSKNGWIELKVIKEYPKCNTTLIKIRHLTPMQRNWLKARGETGGSCCILLQVEKDYYLFDWTKVCELNKGIPRNKMKYHAITSYRNKINFNDLLWLLAHINT